MPIDSAIVLMVLAVNIAPQVPLQLDVHPVAAEDADQAIEQAADAVPPAVERGAAGQRDQADDGLVGPRRAGVDHVQVAVGVGGAVRAVSHSLDPKSR